MILSSHAPHLTPEECLADETRDQVKHEHLEGVAYAMAGACEKHNQIRLNVVFHFNSLTKPNAIAAA